MSDTIGATQTLARYVVDAQYADIPPAMRHEAKRALLNWLGCAIGTARHETIERALAALAPFAGAPQAALLGRGERLDILNAAFLNGVSSHVLDFDDTHEQAVHPSAPVYPALLALGEWRKLAGANVLHAFVLGVEVECRVALSVFPEHYDTGWHVTGTAGVFGAAAAASKLLGLNAQQMTWALGIAATQSAGLREMFGSMCKSFHEAHVRVTLRDGRVLAHHVPHALGTLQRPMSDQDLEAKFRALVAPLLPAHQVNTLIDLCWNVEDLRDVGDIARAAAPLP